MTAQPFTTTRPARAARPSVQRPAGRWAALPWPEPRPDRLMRVVALMLFAYVWRVQDTFPVLGKIKLPLLAAGLALALYTMDRHPWRRIAELRNPLLSLIVALLAIMVLGIPMSLYRFGSVEFVVKNYLPSLVFMGLVAASIRSTRDIEWLAKMNLIGAFIYALVVNLFFSPGPEGRLGDLVFYDANDFALIMICSIPFAVYFMRQDGGARRRLLGLICLAMFVIGIVKSGSRGGFLGLIVVMLYVLLRYRAIPARVRLFTAIAGVLLFAAAASGKYWELIGTILHPKEDYNWSAQEGRREVWKRGIGYMLSHPVLGVGVSAFPTAEGRLSEVGRELASKGRGWKWSVAHNSFIETGAELGVVGLGIFIAIFVVAMRSLSRIQQTGMNAYWVAPREMALAQLLIGAYVGFIAAGFFVSAEYFSYLYFLFGLTLGLEKLIRLRRQAVLAAASRRPGASRGPAPTLARQGVPSGR